MSFRLAAALLIFCTFAATAAEPDWAKPFRKYVTSPAYLNEMAQNVARLERRFAPDCAGSMAGMRRQELRIVAPPSFIRGLPIPQGGQWREQVEIKRCDRPVLHNVLVTGVEGGTPELTMLLPGSSKADGLLQFNATSAAFAIANARTGKGCNDGAQHIVDTRFEDWLENSDTQPIKQRVWREVWTVRLCDRDVAVRVDFRPNGKGGFTHSADLH